MKNQILNTLREYPNGLRLREIAMELHINRLSLITPLHEMKKEGLVNSYSNTDHANGEYYDIWTVA